MVGALGGLGRSIATWMVERGAKHLVFISRSGADKPQASHLVSDLKDMGAEPEVLRCDILDQEGLAQAVDSVVRQRPLKGVLQAAMVENVSLGVEPMREPSLSRANCPQSRTSPSTNRATINSNLCWLPR